MTDRETEIAELKAKRKELLLTLDMLRLPDEARRWMRDSLLHEADALARVLERPDARSTAHEDLLMAILDAVRALTYALAPLAPLPGPTSEAAP